MEHIAAILFLVLAAAIFGGILCMILMTGIHLLLDAFITILGFCCAACIACAAAKARTLSPMRRCRMSLYRVFRYYTRQPSLPFFAAAHK